MAQHDYVIANGTGAAVRSDLNNALAAIVSQNSGATEPATMYAYQWWADTTTGLLKLRNGANNAWITLRELDGTLTIEDGTAGAPGLAFADDLNTGVFSPGADQVAFTAGGTARLTATTTGITSALPVDVPLGSASAPTVTFTGDLNTGIYSPGADQVGISTGGTSRFEVSTTAATSTLPVVHPLGAVGTPSITFTGDLNTGIWSPAADTIAFSEGGVEAMRIDSSGRLGIGTTSPGSALEINAAAATSPFIAKINTAEVARIDSSGRLLVGTSTARAVGGLGTASFQQESTGYEGASASWTLNQNTGDSPWLVLAKSRGTSLGSFTVVNSGDALGRISFQGADGSVFRQGASIFAEADAAWSSGDAPGRLVFSVTADGASSPTERMRITNLGVLKQSTTGTYISTTARYNEFSNLNATSGDTNTYFTLGANTSDTSSIFIYCFQSGVGGKMIVYGNGNIQNANNSYGALSDIKLKENIVDANSQWDDIKALQVRNYNLKEGQTHTQIGLVAQEVEPISPGLVYESPDRDAEGNDLGTVTKSVNYSVLYMKAVKALQEAMDRIETLEARLTAAGIA